MELGEITRSLYDELSCIYVFYRQYQLPCSHVYQFNLVTNAFAELNWKRWGYMFEEGGFEIYEDTPRKHVTKDSHDEPDGSTKHVLVVREVFDETKGKFLGT